MLRENLNENSFTLIQNFSNKIGDEWIQKSDELIFLFLEYNSNAAKTLDRAREHLHAFNQLTIESGYLSFKMLNLVLYNSIVGFNIGLESLDEIQGRKLISKTNLIASMKELASRMNERKKSIHELKAEKTRISFTKSLTCSNHLFAEANVIFLRLIRQICINQADYYNYEVFKDEKHFSHRKSVCIGPCNTLKLPKSEHSSSCEDEYLLKVNEI